MALRWLGYIIYSFPLQLFILHLKKHHLILIFWAMLFLFVLRSNGGHYGIPLLFLDPEYLGEVSYMAFAIIGFAYGGFVMAWNISFYIMNSYRFTFLAAISKPFVRFCLNNSILPVVFVIVYSISVIHFQQDEGLTTAEILPKLAGFYAGMVLMVFLTIIYFTFFSYNVHTFLGKLTDKAREKLSSKDIILNKIKETYEKDHLNWPVETYFVNPFKVRLVRDTGHYDRKLVMKVLRQHHRSGFVIELISLFTLLAFGFLIDNPVFRIPAAAGILLFFTVVMVLASALTYWFQGWRLVALVIIVLGLNLASKYDMFSYRHRLFGLDYSLPKAKFDLDFLQQSSSEALLKKDIAQTTNILNIWHRKVRTKYKNNKPPIIFINAAGGGLKSYYWVMDILQYVDSSMQGKLFDHCVLITGASGGMMGAAYYRELKLRHLTEKGYNPYDRTYLDDAGKDLLNPIISAVVTNDIFFPWQRIVYEGKVYRKDRGYVFDLALNENTHYLMNKPISAYEMPEKRADIPMMVLSPTIINDQRILLVSPQQVSYLTRPYIANSKGYLDYLAPDAIEFVPFFKDYGSEHVRMVSLLRMNSSFPFLLPPIYLPSDPELKVMDAGIRENYGIGVSSRFYNVFREWIDKYTSGAIFIQFRTDPRFIEPEDMKKTTFLRGLTSPVGSIYSNFMEVQEYTNDQTIGFLENASKTDINIINFAYRPVNKKEEAGMSFHLSEREKREVRSALYLPENQESVRRLKELLH